MAFYWNPSPIIFKLPLLNLSLRWYSLFFALGFFGGAYIFYLLIQSWITENLPTNALFLSKQARLKLVSLLEGADSKKVSDLDLKDQISSLGNTSKKKVQAFISAELTQLIMVYLMLGILIGARLGEVFFYSGSEFLYRPWEIFMTWKGGLSSHGGLVGVIVASYLFLKRMRISFPTVSQYLLLNYLSIPSAFCAIWIRIGNFFNQEILGYKTNVPWAVYFGAPFDGSYPAFRHPVQIYEAICYVLVFAHLMFLFYIKRKQCYLFPVLLIEIFACRFIIEFYKQPQEVFNPFLGIKMGQWLSIPCIIVGLYFLLHSRSNKQV